MGARTQGHEEQEARETHHEPSDNFVRGPFVVVSSARGGPRAGMLHMPHFAFEVVLTAIVVTLLVMIPTLLLYKLLVEPRFVRRERSGAVCCGCACLDLFLLNAEVRPRADLRA